MDARGKLGEHERSVRVAHWGDSKCIHNSIYAQLKVWTSSFITWRLASVYQIGLPSFPVRDIKCWLKPEWNECHVFYGVIRKVKMCRYCWWSVGVTRIVRSLSVFCESFTKCTFSFSMYPIWYTEVKRLNLREWAAEMSVDCLPCFQCCIHLSTFVTLYITYVHVTFIS